MEAVSACLQNRSQPQMLNLNQKVVTTSSQELCVNVTEFQDFVFLLGKLWKVDLDEIKNHWTVTLFADELVDQGKSVRILEIYCTSVCTYSFGADISNCW